MKPYDFEDLYERMLKILDSQKTIIRRIAD